MKVDIIRGLPGSGKSTLAARLCKNVVSADDFFMRGGVYCFDPVLLSDAHESCKRRFESFLRDNQDVAVANTFSRHWEFTTYLSMAIAYNATITVIDLFDQGMPDKELARRNVHKVPESAIAAMRARWEK